METAGPRPGTDRFSTLIGPLLLIIEALVLLAPGLDHPFIQNWDEAIHQAVARGTFESFFRPHLFAAPLKLAPPGDWLQVGVWLHKPTGPFWLAALMIHAVGAIPAASRGLSLLADIVAAIAVFRLGLPIIGRFLSWSVAALFLALPWVWAVTQGYQFGDITDTTLAAGVAVAMLLLVIAVERDSIPWAAAAGATVGAAFLCKSGLALAPVGVAGVLMVLRWMGICPGPRLAAFLALLGMTILVAAPWNIYCAFAFPEEFKAESIHTFSHLSNPTPELRMWSRPVDAIFNEVNQYEFAGLPSALPLLAGLWCAVRALRRREMRVVALALWVIATWTVLSLSTVKVMGVAWGVGAGVLLAIGILVQDARQSWPLACAFAGAAGTDLLIRFAPMVGRWRAHLPTVLEQTRERPGLFEGVILVLGGLALGAVLAVAARLFVPFERLSRHARLALVLVGAVAIAPGLVKANQERRQSEHQESALSYTREVGTALNRVLPARAVIDLQTDRDPNHAFPQLELMFWTGRMAYRRMEPPLLSKAAHEGYHRYIVSAMAEPFAPVGDVPPQAWLRAYDAERPAPEPPLPPGVEPLEAKTGNFTLLGVGSGKIDRDRDRYALYVRLPSGAPIPPITFILKDGSRASSAGGEFIDHAGTATKRSWVILPAIGPPRDSVVTLIVGPAAVSLKPRS